MAGEQSRDQKVRARGVGEKTLAVTSIEQAVKPGGELAMVFMALVVGELGEFVDRSDVVSLEPGVARAPPVGGDRGRNRVCQPSGDEISGAPLPPVREVLAVNVCFGGRVVGGSSKRARKVVQSFSSHRRGAVKVSACAFVIARAKAR
jgi:hypothetical protein